ncbi:MAG: glycosyltransferase family 4 protein [Pseudomonadota bacterium]
MTRVAIFTSHPIQYQVPWFRALARQQALETEVVFSYIPDAVEQGVGFGEAFTWDIPLLSGYNSRVLKTYSLPNFLSGSVRRWSLSIGNALQDLRPDVALILGWQEPPLIQALVACRRRNIPIILRGESNSLRKRPKLVTAVHRAYLKNCDAVLAIGEANANFYHEAGVPNNKIISAPYFVENERFINGAAKLCGDRLALRERWSIPADATCFAFVGKLEPKKRILDFLKGLELAHRQGGKVAGLVVGNGSDMEAAETFVRQNNLPVTFAGFLNQSEIHSAYVASDAIVLPSDYGETWGLVVNEAMASSIPAIVSDRVGCANDLVVHGKTGLVFPFGDVTALATKLSELSADQSLRERLATAAIERVSSNYTIDHAVARTLEAIKLVTPCFKSKA